VAGNNDIQFLIASHSPILLAYPGAQIFSFAEGKIHEVRYQETSPYQVRQRNHYGDASIWVREQRAQAVLVDIDTQGDEAHAGVPVLRELRILERGLVLISLSRSRARAVEKQAVEAGSDAHFHSPIDPSEPRMVLKATLEDRIEEMERARMQQQVLGAQQASGPGGTQRSDAAGLRRDLTGCRQPHQRDRTWRERHRQKNWWRAPSLPSAAGGRKHSSA
jgi:CheY-like chemotaxis protein